MYRTARDPRIAHLQAIVASEADVRAQLFSARSAVDASPDRDDLVEAERGYIAQLAEITRAQAELEELVAAQIANAVAGSEIHALGEMRRAMELERAATIAIATVGERAQVVLAEIVDIAREIVVAGTAGAIAGRILQEGFTSWLLSPSERDVLRARAASHLPLLRERLAAFARVVDASDRGSLEPFISPSDENMLRDLAKIVVAVERMMTAYQTQCVACDRRIADILAQQRALVLG
jgi:hypothetical protein